MNRLFYSIAAAIVITMVVLQVTSVAQEFQTYDEAVYIAAVTHTGKRVTFESTPSTTTGKTSSRGSPSAIAPRLAAKQRGLAGCGPIHLRSELSLS